MKLPSSVTNGWCGSSIRKAGWPPIVSRKACCDSQSKGKTSTGRACLLPRRSDIFDSSTTIISRSVACATIFSWSSAPPPPLIRLSWGSTSSAPSMVTSILIGPCGPSRGSPACVATLAISAEVAKVLMPSSSPAAWRRAISRTAWMAVDPVPRPTVMPGSTKRTA